jgi:arginine utilization protein RocB
MDKYSKTIKNLALDLTRIPSVVGTDGEIQMAKKIYDNLSRLRYFKANPEKLKLVDLKNDSLGRKYVMAIIEAENKTSDTVLLPQPPIKASFPSHFPL